MVLHEGEPVSVAERLQREGIIVSPEAEEFLQAVEIGETDDISCWRASQVERQGGSAIEGRGLFAVDDITQGTLIAIKPGHVVDSRTIKEHADVVKGSHQQIGPDKFLTGLTSDEVEKNLVGYNHSCEPNARIVVLKGVPLAFLVTRKPIEAGKDNREITTDYGVSWMSNTQLMKACQCGTQACRRVIAPLWDWESEALQQRYAGEFPWFMQDAIDELNDLSPAQRKRLDYEEEPFRLAAGLKVMDELVREQEARMWSYLEGTPRISHPIRERIYLRTAKEGLQLQGDRAYRLKVAAYLCLRNGSAEEIRSIGIGFTEITKAVRPEAETLREWEKLFAGRMDQVVDYARSFDDRHNR